MYYACVQLFNHGETHGRLMTNTRFYRFEVLQTNQDRYRTQKNSANLLAQFNKALFLIAIILFFAIVNTSTAAAQSSPQDPLPIQHVMQISASSVHNCALLDDGTVRCWGEVEKGASEGQHHANIRTRPEPMRNLPSAIQSVIAGGVNSYEFACAITAEGGVTCWGDNLYGQLGNDSFYPEHLTPVDVVQLRTTVQVVALGDRHSCALLTDQSVMCWGNNVQGQLGDGTNTNRRAPVDVTLLSGPVRAIGADGSHSCALLTSGTVQCWGNNEAGQLGDGTTVASTTPVTVTGLSEGVSAIVLGRSHSCALLQSGTLQCWGDNTAGQLGAASQQPQSTTPVDVANLATDVTLAAAGANHTCAHLADAEVVCWGDNHWGQLGHGTAALSSTVPVNVVGLAMQDGEKVLGLAGGDAHTCALVNDGVQCWGSNTHGQLGHGVSAQHLLPAAVAGLPSDITMLTGDDVGACAITESGGAHCWGNGRPLAISFATIDAPLQSVLQNGGFTCSLTIAGTVYCWGRNSVGQLGDGTTTSSNMPVLVAGLSNIKAIASGYAHTCALTAQGGVKCWGLARDGQLGNGVEIYSSTLPIDVVGLTSGVQSIAAGSDHTCAALSAGGVNCWGSNFDGKLGTSTGRVYQFSPVAVDDLPEKVQTLVAGPFHSCVIINDGDVKCWGAVFRGTELIDGIDGAAISVAAGGSYSVSEAAITHTCVAVTDGRVFCRGDNVFGVLGDGTTKISVIPVQVQGLDEAVSQVVAGIDYTCVLTVSDKVQCWGDNQRGQLGTSTVWSPIPVAVIELAKTYLPLLRH